MSAIVLTLNFIIWVFSISVLVVVPLGILATVFVAPYEIYLGYYKAKNKLPDDFRKPTKFSEELKRAFKFYCDIFRLRKPSF